jgi:4-hydroxybenzoate polyprenyltransferase
MKFNELVKISRPLFWPVLPLVYLGGLTYTNNAITLIALVQAFVLSFPLSILIYGINDIYDKKSDEINPFKNTKFGEIAKGNNEAQIIKAGLIVATILIITSILTTNFINLVCALLLIILSIVYSAPPLRIKTKPPIDSLLLGFLYCFIPFLMGYTLHSSINTLPSEIYYITLAAGTLNIIASIRDYDVDKQVGDKTFAVSYGKTTSTLIAICTLIFIILFGDIDKTGIKVLLLLGILLTLVTSYVKNMNVVRNTLLLGIYTLYTAMIYYLLLLLTK